MESVAGRLDYNDGTTTSKIKSLAAAATPRRHYRIYKVVHSRYQVPSSRYKGASGQISTRIPNSRVSVFSSTTTTPQNF